MIKTDLKENAWRTLSSRYLFNRPWLTARCDTVELPDGRVNPEFYVLEYPSWVNVIARDTDGNFIMVRQYRHGLGETRYELSAGVVEQGEDPLDAAKRELCEETGYVGGEWSLLTVLSGNASTTDNLSYCFVADGVTADGERHLDPTEDLNVEILTLDEVRSLLLDDSIRQSLMAAPLWKYFAINNLL
jgi:8-oxo-dGTP pyrophosphatase MutT (NUDIX family)